MKNTIFSLLAVATIIFSSCGTSKQISADETASIAKITSTKWQLIELAGKPITGLVNGKVPYLEFMEKEGRYSSTGGCNIMNGEFKFEPHQRVRFTRGISTMMACPDMESDKALGEAFQLSDNYTLADGILSLNVGRRAPLAKFKAVASGAALTGTWELDYISGSNKSFNELFPDKKPSITFADGSTQVNGNGGCNTFGSSYDLDGRKIKFNGIRSTRMACQGEGEPLFFQTLEKINVISVDDNTMTMIIGDIAVMRFKKK